MTRALVCGWPSVPGGEATAGDLITMDAVRSILEDNGIRVDVATNVGFPWGVDVRTVPVDRYDHVVFVCGPLRVGPIAAMLDRFPNARRIAVNVSVLDRSVAELFDVVIPRDGGEEDEVRPDLSFLEPPTPVPVIGVVRAHEQPEYPASEHERVHDLIRLVLASRTAATVDFDTRVHPAADPFAAHARSSDEVCSLAARMDVVITTRLHGAVLSLAMGTPVVAIDPVRGGAKLAAQMEAIGWPHAFTVDSLTSEQLAQAIEWCLSDEARRLAREVATRAAAGLDRVRDELIDALGEPAE